MNLKNKTIFDFCKDKQIITEIIGGEYTEDYYKSFPQTVIAEHLIVYAFRVKDEQLFKDAQRLKANAEANFGYICAQAQKDGSIAD